MLLSMNKNDLYEAHRLDMKRVFFFVMFRDVDITSKDKGGETWRKKIPEFRCKVSRNPHEVILNELEIALSNHFIVIYCIIQIDNWYHAHNFPRSQA